MFVGVTTREGRESILMTGSAEVRESPETASVLGGAGCDESVAGSVTVG